MGIKKYTCQRLMGPQRGEVNSQYQIKMKTQLKVT